MVILVVKGFVEIFVFQFKFYNIILYLIYYSIYDIFVYVKRFVDFYFIIYLVIVQVWVSIVFLLVEILVLFINCLDYVVVFNKGVLDIKKKYEGDLIKKGIFFGKCQ